MKKKYLTKILLVAFVALSVVVGAGCAGTKQEGKVEQKNTPQASEVGNSITLVGSDSMQNVVGLLAEEFEAKNPGSKIDVQAGGSGASFAPVRSGTAQLGLVSRNLKDKEQDIKAIEIAKDGIAIVVNNNNPVKSLSKEQIAKIYAGEITNWKEIGGSDLKITVIGREAGSGTTGAFEEIIMEKFKKEIAPSVLRINQSEAIRSTVAKSDATIGYFSLYLADKTVTALKVDDFDATEENVKNGSYPVSRPFNYTYKNEPTGLSKAFVDFTLSPEGQAIIKEEGLISVK